VPRYTEQRIQQLCKEAVEAKTPAKLEQVIPELRAALEEHTRLAKESLRLQRNTIAARDAASKTKKDEPSEEGR
jgi:hypothetical protein